MREALRNDEYSRMLEAVIHPSSKVDPSVTLGPGVVVGPNVRIDAGVYVGAYSVIGGIPEHRTFFDAKNADAALGVWLQEGSRISEFVTVHAGVLRKTVVGVKASVFNHSHVAHDADIGPEAIVGGGCLIAGHCVLMRKAQVAGGTALHQWVVVGPYGFVGPRGFLKQNVRPGEMYIGNPARPAGANVIGLERNGMTLSECRNRFDEAFEQLERLNRP